MEVIHELLGYKHIKIIQNDDMFSFSVDSMLLANFVNVSQKTQKIIELGCGNGPILLFLTLKTTSPLIGIEIQEVIADMAKRSVSINNLENQITIINQDMKGIYKTIGANTCDIVICNPPYFKYQPASNINKNDYLTIARHEVKITLLEVISEAKKLLIDGGFFYLVHRAERFAEIISILTNEGFEIKRAQFVYSKISSNEALFVLIEAKKNGKSGLKVLKPLYIYDDNQEYTKEVKTIFNFKSEI